MHSSQALLSKPFVTHIKTREQMQDPRVFRRHDLVDCPMHQVLHLLGTLTEVNIRNAVFHPLKATHLDRLGQPVHLALEHSHFLLKSVHVVCTF